MSTFVENHDFDGITVIPFVASGGKAVLAAVAANWGTGRKLVHGLQANVSNSNVSDTSLKAWIDSLEE